MGDIGDLISAEVVETSMDVVEEVWGVFNDEAHFEKRLRDGTIHPALREKLVGEPLATYVTAGEAKRHQEYFNTMRQEQGMVPQAGLVVLKVQQRLVKPWRTVAQGTQEWEDIDDGRRPNG